MTEKALGLAAGLLFGFILQRGRVLRFGKQVGAMRLQDMTILKFMLSAILVGMVGLQISSQLGWLQLSHKPMNLGAIVLGGVLFGAGWALAGFCPGTAVGALGEGRLHAGWAVLGMVLGAAVYAEIYPWLKGTVLSWKDWGKVTLPGVLGVHPWTVIVVFAVVTAGLFALFEHRRL